MIKNAVVKIGKTPAVQGGVSEDYIEGEASLSNAPVKSLLKVAKTLDVSNKKDKK
jgi:hypothetical protein